MGRKINKETELTAQQLLFAKEYQIDFNATAAAKRAGYSEKTASAAASRLLLKSKIAALIQDGMTKRVRQIDIKADAVLAEVAAIAFARIGDFVNWDGKSLTVIPKDSLPEGADAVLSEVSQMITPNTTRVSVKMHDKVACLDKLMRHFKLYPSGETTFNFNNLAEQLDEARRKEAERRQAEEKP